MRLVLLLAAALTLQAAKTLDFYFIDVEGGQATLIVTPAGQSLLVDAGWPGRQGRDADRIVAAARRAGVKKIDYLLVTHYHTDHVGGVPQLLERFPVAAVIDHGPNTETGKGPADLTASYEKAVAKVKRIVVKTGDKLPVKGLAIDIVAARGACIQSPVAGGGGRNPLCGSDPAKAEDPSENARSIGFVLQFNKFRFIDLADLTWNKEIELVCPDNRVGAVDMYLVTHHGMNMSGPATIVHALKPRVAVMNNGARKGGSPEAWQVIQRSPGLEDLWQLHYSIPAGKDNNVEDARIANLDEACEGKYIKASVRADGSFTVTNSRNGFARAYAAR